MIDSHTSKEVGWKHRLVSWPTTYPEIKHASDKQILEWYRFLPTATTEEQRELIDKIMKEYRKRSKDE